MVAFLYRMDTGYPGCVNRAEIATVEAGTINTSTPPTAYGIGVVNDPNGIRPPTAADTVVSGIFVRPYPLQPNTGGISLPLGTAGVPPTVGNGDVLRRGYIIVKMQSTAAAVKGAPVAVWIGAAAGPHVPGGVNADAAAAGSNVALPNSYFMGPADTNGIVEIAVNI